MGDGVGGEHLQDLGALRLRAHLLMAGSHRRWERGDRLVQSGQRAGAVYLVVEGRLQVLTSSADGDEAIHALLGPGDLVGELAALDGNPHAADVVALTAGSGMRLTARRFREILSGDVDAALAVATLLASRIRGADHVRTDAASGDVAARVARRLWHLSAGGAGDDAEGVTVTVSQDDLAKWCGASRQAVNVALGRLRTAGIVRTGRGVVTVIDREALLTQPAAAADA